VESEVDGVDLACRNIKKIKKYWRQKERKEESKKQGKQNKKKIKHVPLQSTTKTQDKHSLEGSSRNPVIQHGRKNAETLSTHTHAHHLTHTPFFERAPILKFGSMLMLRMPCV